MSGFGLGMSLNTFQKGLQGHSEANLASRGVK